MEALEPKIVSYIMWKLGCVHPYYVSRALLLAEWISEERSGRKLTSFTYRCQPYGFYIEELDQVIRKLEEEKCARRNQGRKCIEYLCGEPEVPDHIKAILDEVLEKIKGLSQVELNRLVIHDPRYKKMLEG
ncbi:MAG: hypothetical protein J7J94_03140 [Thaumarchaeota archaeon]|nr:hypothetical protein [Nitrososphaerota archaeon]